MIKTVAATLLITGTVIVFCTITGTDPAFTLAIIGVYYGLLGISKSNGGAS